VPQPLERQPDPAGDPRLATRPPGLWGRFVIASLIALGFCVVALVVVDIVTR
jgi:hypothetical protein